MSPKRVIKIFMIVLLSVVITGGCLIGYYEYKIKPVSDENAKDLVLLQQIMTNYYQDVYVAATDLKAGDTLTVDKLVKKSTYIQDVSNLITLADMGKILLADVAMDSTISKSLCLDVVSSDDQRLVEYTCIKLNGKTQVGSYIDIRLRKTDGSDYVVLAKKTGSGHSG